MVSIFTYRDERKLFAVIGTIVVAALIALAQVDAARTGKTSLVTIFVGSTIAVGQSALANTGGAIRAGIGGVADIPRLWVENQRLGNANRELTHENEALREAVAQSPEAGAIARAAKLAPRGIVALAIAFDIEGESRAITIDRGSVAGVAVDAAVIDDGGAVGRVIETAPFTSKVLLLIDPTSKVPAVVQRGRWWGIATGTGTQLQVQFLSQDAMLRPGDIVVTGEGHSFHAGIPIGRVAKISHPEGALYQSAVLEPAAAFGRLEHVLVLPRQ